MGFLYLPWRKRYKRSSVTDVCPFCHAFAASDDRANLIVKRFCTCALFLCLHPYNAGHLLVIPYRHIGVFAELTEEERYEMMDIMNKAIKVLFEIMGCQGMNAGINLGDGTAGGSIPQHIHFHLVPRFKGDTNFLPILTGTRLITSDLMEIYDKLVGAFGDER
ncbi:MAG: HIT domain-containing protein [Candidatus Babeliaceae bacterium]|nr:HIT domain-containing protein [Candidatus Babeliaceae bacterium]